MYNNHLRTTEVVPQFSISSSFRARVQQWGMPSGTLYPSKYILFLKVWKHGLVSWTLPWLLCNFLPDKWSGKKGNSQVVFPFLWLSGAELLSGIIASRQNSELGSRNMTLRCSGVRFLLAVLCLRHTHLCHLVLRPVCLLWRESLKPLCSDAFVQLMVVVRPYWAYRSPAGHVVLQILFP